MPTYHGAENANLARVHRYLAENYAEADGETRLTDERVTELVGKHFEAVQRGIAILSHASYLGDNIADAEGLMWVGDNEDSPA